MAKTQHLLPSLFENAAPSVGQSVGQSSIRNKGPVRRSNSADLSSIPAAPGVRRLEKLAKIEN